MRLVSFLQIEQHLSRMRLVTRLNKREREKTAILIRPIEPKAIEVTSVIYDEDIVKLI
jgi:hypothetical protein